MLGCQVLFFLISGFVAISLGQYHAARDFCRRFGHQSAVVDNRLYVDGGFVNWKPFTEASQNLSNPFLVFSDLDDSAVGMPTLHANLSKNATIPSVHGGVLWDDSVNKRLYLYGGETHQTAPTNFLLYSYDILNDQWDSLGPPTGPVAITPTSYGAGVSIPERGEAYYYGGWFNNASIPGWTGPPQASNRMIRYTMDSNSWSNLTGPDNVKRAEGVMVFIPIADAGMLVYFGGSQDLNGTLTPQPLDTIFLYDVANGKWYSQKTSGRTPEDRRLFCAGATWAQDQSSYNMGGFSPGIGYDDIYVLTIPSFQWIRGPYPAGSNVTGPYPKSMMTCNVVNSAQMLVIGGTYSNDTTFMCDAESVWGQHNMALSEENPDNNIWAEYIPSVTTYTVPTFIRTVVGGEETGGATVTAPADGFAAPELADLMTRKAVITPRSPTRAIPTPTTSSPGNGTDISPPPQLSTGAIAGIAVGGFVALVAVLAGCCCYIRHRQKSYQQPRISGQSQPSTAWGSSIPSVISPASTHATYAQPMQSPVMLPSTPFYRPAELATNDQRYVWARSNAGSPHEVTE
ncbi:Kelch domain-containing protein 3 [Madurella mycetomatis]|uniref:Kelch domain-containing protein 3 n=1 Tax=Madurella mycetomatis TaxID=100816 RepID=A0A175VYW8_9PEZI|nr:Kelch domain-containing protein 3 [Madurella mycetomatis]KXX83000.1 Kelch domain-containing protein 3 [Madurella mycetomatis]